MAIRPLDPRRTLWPYRTRLERELEAALREDPPAPLGDEELHALNPHLHIVLSVAGPGNRERRY